MVSKILSDFSVEPESSWLIAGEDGVLEGVNFKRMLACHQEDGQPGHRQILA